MSKSPARSDTGETSRLPEGGTRHVVAYVRGLIEDGSLHPGNRLPAERDLARQVGVSRPTVRAGLRALAAMGVVESRHGSGTYIPDGPPTLGSEPLSFLAALHGFTRDEMYEARRILEVGAAGLAAVRATPEQLASLSEEIANQFASVEDPVRFLLHDITFHRRLAEASGNQIVATIVEMVSAMYYARRRRTTAQSLESARRAAAEMHRRIYQAVRARDVAEARLLMHQHLVQASEYQAQEEGDERGPARGAVVEDAPPAEPPFKPATRRARSSQ